MASRRLTRTLRSAFVKAVMDAVPKPDDDVCSKEMQEILYQHMPKEVQQVFLLCPEWLDNNSTEAYCSVDHVAKEYGGGYYERRIQLRYKWYSYNDSTLPQAAQDYKEKICTIVNNREKLRAKIIGVAESCTTIAQLKEALPEMVQYMPEDTPAPKKNLPVIANLMAEVVAMGWPGGKIVGGEVVPA